MGENATMPDWLAKVWWLTDEERAEAARNLELGARVFAADPTLADELRLARMLNSDKAERVLAEWLHRRAFIKGTHGPSGSAIEHDPPSTLSGHRHHASVILAALREGLRE